MIQVAVNKIQCECMWYQMTCLRKIEYNQDESAYFKCKWNLEHNSSQFVFYRYLSHLGAVSNSLDLAIARPRTLFPIATKLLHVVHGYRWGIRYHDHQVYMCYHNFYWLNSPSVYNIRCDHCRHMYLSLPFEFGMLHFRSLVYIARKLKKT